VHYLHIVHSVSRLGRERNLMAHNEKQESGNRNQDGKEKGKSKKAKV
jgi:hypothetical protein